MDGQCKMWTWDLREKGLSGEETHNKAISGGKLSDTVEPHLTVTSLNQSPLHSGHPGSVPNDFPW